MIGGGELMARARFNHYVCRTSPQISGVQSRRSRPPALRLSWRVLQLLTRTTPGHHRDAVLVGNIGTSLEDAGVNTCTVINCIEVSNFTFFGKRWKKGSNDLAVVAVVVYFCEVAHIPGLLIQVEFSCRTTTISSTTQT